ncbi:MAG: hypothetical protein V8Q32_00075 [Anaerotignum faecicola]
MGLPFSGGALTLLAQIPLKWQREFFFLLPYRRYHHLILRQAENGYWLGLPGEYSEEEEAEAQRFGFRGIRRVGWRLGLLDGFFGAGRLKK